MSIHVYIYKYMYSVYHVRVDERLVRKAVFFSVFACTSSHAWPDRLT